MTAQAPGPVAIIIGAGGGIGRALVDRLSGSGWRLVAAGRSGPRLEELPEAAVVARHALDARRVADVRALFEDTAARFGAPDAAVNLAGSLLLKPAHLTSEEEWREHIAQNLDTAFNTVSAAASVMRAGSVVLMSSVAASLGLPGHEAIAAAKAGVEGLVRSAAAGYAGRGLRFNAVAPGLTETPLTERLCSNPAVRKSSVAMHPLGRIGRAADIAAAIHWLMSEESAWVTGQVINVDGGLSTARSRG